MGKRPDGYHEIDTVFQTISLHDTIRLSQIEEPRIALSCDERSLPSDHHNLVWRAAAALETRCALRKGVHIRLEKRIPTRAGLGGGSCDTAVALIALSHLWQTDLTEGELLEIARGLGADVPFFLFGGTARGTGTGKEIMPLQDAPETYLLIIKPNASIATSRAYELLKAPALTTSEPKIILSSSRAIDHSEDFRPDALHNDFEAAVLPAEAEIERAKAALLKAGARAALLAGSGSAVFGILDSKNTQVRAIQAIKLEAGWRVFPCRTVGRDQYRSAMGPAAEVLRRLQSDQREAL